MYSVKPSRCQNNNKTKKNTCKDTDTILRSLKIRIKKGKNFCKSIKFYTHTLNTFDASWHIRSKKVKWCGCFLFINERNGFAKTSSPDIHTYILLVVLVCSIAKYFYELCSKITQIYYTPKRLISYNYPTAFFFCCLSAHFS